MKLLWRLRQFFQRLGRRTGRSKSQIISYLLVVAIVLVGSLMLPNGQRLSDHFLKLAGEGLVVVGILMVALHALHVGEEIGGSMDLLKMAERLKIDRLYENRAEALDDIAAELKSATGDVKIRAITGSDFFGVGQAATSISRLVESHNNVHLRVFLLDRNSPHACYRAWMEERYNLSKEDQESLDEGEIRPTFSQEEFNTSTMQARMENARAALNYMSKAVCAPTELSARFYMEKPTCFLVAVNRSVFVEFYSDGVDENYRPAPVLPCMAKRTLVLRFRRHSFNADIYENDFDRQWRHSETRRFLPRGQGTSSLTPNCSGSAADLISLGLRVGTKPGADNPVTEGMSKS